MVGALGLQIGMGMFGLTLITVYWMLVDMGNELNKTQEYIL